MYPSIFVRLLSAVLLLSLTVTGCDSNEPEAGAGEEEFFTRVTISLTGDDGSTATATASDPDGDKANIQFTTLSLNAGVTYTGTISLHDDINGEEVTEEVEEEGTAHLFFYTPLTEKLSVTPLDTDANGLPLGLRFRLQVTPGSGFIETLNVKLAHYEDEADKEASHTPENRPGSELDLDLNFPVVVN